MVSCARSLILMLDTCYSSAVENLVILNLLRPDVEGNFEFGRLNIYMQLSTMERYDLLEVNNICVGKELVRKHQND